MQVEGINIEWLGHSGFKIKENKVIYIDPFEIEGGERADVIFITHSHYDHCSIADLKKLVTSQTVIVTHPDCQSKLSGKVQSKEVVLVEPGKKYTAGGVQFETVPAYNTNKDFHPKHNEWVGYIITIKGKRVYHAGDTDLIPEMKSISADIALLPVSGTYVMIADEAAKAAAVINAKAFVPMHYGKIVGTKPDAERFKELCSKPVVILEKMRDDSYG